MPFEICTHLFLLQSTKEDIGIMCQFFIMAIKVNVYDEQIEIRINHFQIKSNHSSIHAFIEYLQIKNGDT